MRCLRMVRQNGASSATCINSTAILAPSGRSMRIGIKIRRILMRHCWAHCRPCSERRLKPTGLTCSNPPFEEILPLIKSMGYQRGTSEDEDENEDEEDWG